jgi:HKD family nuclease
MTIITSFDNRPLSPLVPDPAVIIGGTTLIHEFMRLVNESGQPGHLAIAVPFMNSRLVDELCTWQGIVQQRITCTIVTGAGSTSEDACRSLLSLPWRSVCIQKSRTLHAKAYAFVGANRFRVALIGSHNLTYGGTRHNQEAGVLFISRTQSELSTAIDSCVDQIRTTGNRGTTIYDSTTWPEGILVRKKL